jgi:hypothetical protein
LSPDRDQLRLWPFTKSVFRTSLILLGLRLLYVVISNNQEKIAEVWNKLTNLIF